MFLALCSTSLVASGRRIWEDDTLEKGGLGPDSSLTMTARILGGSYATTSPTCAGVLDVQQLQHGRVLPVKECVLSVSCAASDEWALVFLLPRRLGRRSIWAGHRKYNVLAIPRFAEALFQPQPQPVHKGKPDMTSALKGDGMAVFKGFAWAGGFRKRFWSRSRPAWFPKRTDPGNAKEKALAEKKAQLTALRARIVRQEQSVENAKESLERASEKLLHMRNEKEQLLAQYQEIETQFVPELVETAL